MSILALDFKSNVAVLSYSHLIFRKQKHSQINLISQKIILQMSDRMTCCKQFENNLIACLLLLISNILNLLRINKFDNLINLQLIFS